MTKIQTENFKEVSYRKIGHGPPIIVLNGGPGLDLHYLLDGLSCLAKWRTTYFFDQFGCGDDLNNPLEASFQRTIEHAVEFIESIGANKEPFGLVGHSMGVPILLNLLTVFDNVNEAIILNPCPSSKSNWQKAMPNRNISSEDHAKINELAKLKTPESGVEMIEIFGRYDVLNYPPKTPIHFTSFDYELCERVQNSMGDFDFGKLVSKLPHRSILVLGEKDFISPEHLQDFIDGVKTTETIGDTKHMPFCEKPDVFEKVMEDFFSN